MYWTTSPSDWRRVVPCIPEFRRELVAALARAKGRRTHTDLSASTTRISVRSEANSINRLCPGLQVLQGNVRKGGSHGDAEGQTRDQPRNALAVHLTSPLFSNADRHIL